VGLVTPAMPPIRISVSVTPGTPVSGVFGQLSPDGMPEPRIVSGPPVATDGVVAPAAVVAVSPAAVVSVVAADVVSAAPPVSSSSSPQLLAINSTTESGANHRIERLMVPPS
jgi:hypothetical protein